MASVLPAEGPAKPLSAKTSLLLLLLILGLGLALRVYHLGAYSLWFDEGFTRFYSETPLSYLWADGFKVETNPPMYYTIMHFWIPLFGSSEVALRSFSVIASMILIVLVYILGKELGGRTMGLLAALLLALSPSEIWYAQEARTYALLQVTMALTLLGAARYLSPQGSWRNLLTYGFGAIIAIYCHNTAQIFVSALNLVMLGLIVWDPGFRPRLLAWVGANAVVALAVLPLFLNALSQTESANLHWISPFTSFGFLRELAEIVGGTAASREFLQGRILSYLLLLLVAILLLRFRKLDRRSLALLVLVPLGYVVMVLLLDLHKPILISRILVWLWIPLSLLLAHLLIHAAKMRSALLILIIAVFTIGLNAQLFPSLSLKENWRDLVQGNQDVLKKSDFLVLGSSTAAGSFIYYLPEDLPRMSYWHPETSPYPPSFTNGFLYEHFKIPAINTNGLLAAIKSGKRVCLVLGRQPQIALVLSGLLPNPDYRFVDESITNYEIEILAWNYDVNSPQSESHRN